MPPIPRGGTRGLSRARMSSPSVPRAGTGGRSGGDAPSGDAAQTAALAWWGRSAVAARAVAKTEGLCERAPGRWYHSTGRDTLGTKRPASARKELKIKRYLDLP